MKRLPAISLALLSVLGTSLMAAEGGSEVAIRLKSSKLDLLQGIAQAEKTQGKAISAKFEMKDGVLMLSIYTARAGLGTDPEHNVLVELIGDATIPSWAPKTEVFADAEHLKRSAMHLTLVQSSKLSLTDAIRRAASATGGQVYSAIPAIRAGVPVYDVTAAVTGGTPRHVLIDASSGAVLEK